MTESKVINLKEKLGLFSEYFQPRGIARLNNYVFKLAKIKGDFIWHSHDETDEAFLILKGQLFIELEDQTITLNEGELYVVPKGVQHRPYAKEECHLMLVEPFSTVNTGHEESDLRIEEIGWI